MLAHNWDLYQQGKDVGDAVKSLVTNTAVSTGITTACNIADDVIGLVPGQSSSGFGVGLAVATTIYKMADAKNG